MSKKQIPAKTILVCDRCGANGEEHKEGGFRFGGLYMKIEQWVAGLTGVGGMTMEYDFCQACSNSFNEWKTHKSEVPK